MHGRDAGIFKAVLFLMNIKYVLRRQMEYAKHNESSVLGQSNVSNNKMARKPTVTCANNTFLTSKIL